MRITPTNIIDGKHVKDMVHLPLGAFKALVREKVDPLWGVFGDELRGFKANVSVEKIKRETHDDTITVAAPDEETAKGLIEKKAQFQAQGEYGDEYDDINVWVGKITEVTL